MTYGHGWTLSTVTVELKKRCEIRLSKIIVGNDRNHSLERQVAMIRARLYVQPGPHDVIAALVDDSSADKHVNVLRSSECK